MRLTKTPRTPQFTPSINRSYRDEWGKYVPFKIQALEPVLEEV